MAWEVNVCVRAHISDDCRTLPSTSMKQKDNFKAMIFFSFYNIMMNSLAGCEI